MKTSCIPLKAKTGSYWLCPSFAWRHKERRMRHGKKKTLQIKWWRERRGFERGDGLMFTPGSQEVEKQRRSSSLDQVLLEQSLVEQQRAGRGALLLQAEDQVPEVDPRDPLPHLPSGGRGGAGRAWRASCCLEHNERTVHQKHLLQKE